MNTKINTFIFDCFGVICTPVVTHWYEENMLKRGLSDENFKNMLREFDLGKMSEEDIAERFMGYDGIHKNKEKIIEEVDSFLKVDANLAEIIKRLKNKGHKTVLLSNANASFFHRKVYTEYPEFKNMFDEIIISSDVGMVKPNEDIYLYTLERVASKPEESLFIDDAKKNVDTAEKLGMSGFVYTEVDSFTDYIKNMGIDLDN